jgi:pimeloyl-ACP methyl ester carboxylesterase
MGGAIAQTIAIEHPGRVRSLTSMMSTTGDPAAGQPKPGTLAAVFAGPRRWRCSLATAGPPTHAIPVESRSAVGCVRADPAIRSRVIRHAALRAVNARSERL